MKTEQTIDYVGDVFGSVRISFDNAHWGDIVIPMKAYEELGKPSVGDKLFLRLKTE